jgi:hypothetical protein
MWHILGRRHWHTGLWWGNVKEGNHLEDQDIYLVDNIKVDHKETDYEGVEWINVAEDSDKCHVVVIMIINLPVP